MEEANVLHIPTDLQHSLDPNLSGSLQAGRRKSSKQRISWKFVVTKPNYKAWYNICIKYCQSLSRKVSDNSLECGETYN